jgi:hypothetical protein
VTGQPPDPGPLLGEGALGDAVARLAAAARPLRTIDGWATVELDRAQEEVTDILVALGEPEVAVVADDRVLGARCRLLRFEEAREVLLLEPSTEGRLAAALVRHGEGFVARYLIADVGAVERVRRAGFTLTSAGHGPFGSQRLVVGPRSGPFVVVAGPDG